MKPGFIAYLAAVALLVSLIAASGASPAIADSGVTSQVALAGTGSPVAGEVSGVALMKNRRAVGAEKLRRVQNRSDRAAAAGLGSLVLQIVHQFCVI